MKFTCKCGASHERGPVNGGDVYRCLKCGETMKASLFERIVASKITDAGLAARARCVAESYGARLEPDVANVLLHAVDRDRVGQVLDVLEHHFKEVLAFQHPEIRGSVLHGGVNQTEVMFLGVCHNVLELGRPVPSVNVNDSVTIEGESPGDLWTVHEVHLPTMDGEKTLISVRPTWAPKGVHCKHPGAKTEEWLPYHYLTVEIGRARKIKP